MSSPEFFAVEKKHSSVKHTTKLQPFVAEFHHPVHKDLDVICNVFAQGVGKVEWCIVILLVPSLEEGSRSWLHVLGAVRHFRRQMRQPTAIVAVSIIEVREERLVFDLPLQTECIHKIGEGCRYQAVRVLEDGLRDDARL